MALIWISMWVFIIQLLESWVNGGWVCKMVGSGYNVRHKIVSVFYPRRKIVFIKRGIIGGSDFSISKLSRFSRCYMWNSHSCVTEYPCLLGIYSENSVTFTFTKSVIQTQRWTWRFLYRESRNEKKKIVLNPLIKKKKILKTSAA